MPVAPFHHLTWFALHHAYRAGGTYVHHAGSRECLGLVLHAETPLASIVGGRETTHDLRGGLVGIVPPDRQTHTVVATPARDTEAFVLLVPPDVLGAVADEEGLRADADLPGAFAFADERLGALLAHLRRLDLAGAAESPDAEAAARELILEVAARRGGRRPQWERDRSVLDARTMEAIRRRIDGHLGVMPRLDDLARLAGLSPSHFARTFRRSTGSSVERFVQRRRIRAALRGLPGDATALAALASRLGFASQSHFTRHFSALTGMTPARYRRGFPLRDCPRTHRNGSTDGADHSRAGALR